MAIGVNAWEQPACACTRRCQREQIVYTSCSKMPAPGALRISPIHCGVVPFSASALARRPYTSAWGLRRPKPEVRNDPSVGAFYCVTTEQLRITFA
jgi:hypothetical protein